MSHIEKEKLIKADIASIENRVRHAFNQGYDLGYKEGKANCSEIPTGSTTKNDLGVDAVSRQAVIDLMMQKWGENFSGDDAMQESIDAIREMPSVTPQEPRWIPVSERLPNDRDWYLGIFKESNTGWINPLPFICDYVGRKTKATTKEFWILRGFTDRDYKDCDYYYNLECVAWMPLPQPYQPEIPTGAERSDKE